VFHWFRINLLYPPHSALQAPAYLVHSQPAAVWGKPWPMKKEIHRWIALAPQTKRMENRGKEHQTESQDCGVSGGPLHIPICRPCR